VDFKDIVRLALQECRQDLLDALDGLTGEERRFQPDPESHHVDFALWHIARVEDDWVQRFAQRADSVWQRDGWHTRFGMPATSGGTGYTAEQVADFPAFDLSEMLTYYDAVRESTLDYFDGISREDLDKTPHPERRPGYTIAAMLGHIIVEQSMHTGQIAYLRGMQRGLDQ
jgi:uncharacterized damage-inducible protein DinB